MRWQHTEDSRADFNTAPKQIQRAFEKQADFLIHNLRHPSLHAKKFDESGNIWQARVTLNWRFYFIIENDCYIILSITAHPK